MFVNLNVKSEIVLFHCYSLAYFAIAAKRINQFDIWQKIILLNDIQICNNIFFYFLPFSIKTDANLRLVNFCVSLYEYDRET